MSLRDIKENISEEEKSKILAGILESFNGDPNLTKKLVDDYKKDYGVEKKKSYPQNWFVYYSACKNEKFMVWRIIKDAVDYLEISKSIATNGRPSVNLSDIIKCLCIKAYSGLSSWRSDSELRIAQRLGIVDNIYKRSALNKYLGKPEVTLLLKKLLRTIAEPVAVIETQLTTDATGIGLAYSRKRWVEVRNDHQQHKLFVKLHIICGAKSNVVFAANITKGTAHESPLLKALIEETVEYVEAREISADSGYLSRDNVNYSSESGMQAFIMPKKNTSTKKGGLGAWGAMVRLWRDNYDLFALHYHQRSNSESTFSMIKRKFGDYVRAKSEIGQINEVLTKTVCHNACVLGEALLEFDIKPKFMVT